MAGPSKLNVSASKACKLCHGPLASSMPVVASPAMHNSASRSGTSIPAAVDCHSHCMTFACPGCVAKDKKSYSILNMKNHIYDYQCHECMNDVPLPACGGSGARPNLIARETAPAAVF